MQHKTNRKTTNGQYDLSTRLSAEELTALKRKMPSSWVEKIQMHTGYSPAKIREALRDPAKYDKLIIDTALNISAQYIKDAASEVTAQRERLKEILAS